MQTKKKKKKKKKRKKNVVGNMVERPVIVMFCFFYTL